MKMLYRIIYLWKGERHVADQTCDLSEAKDTLHLLKRDGWQAWIETSTTNNKLYVGRDA